MLAAWALLVSFLGVTRENFPGTTSAAERLVGSISIVLVVVAIGAAIYTGGERGGEEKGGGGRTARGPAV